jgi:hypothetical protein
MLQLALALKLQQGESFVCADRELGKTELELYKADLEL